MHYRHSWPFTVAGGGDHLSGSPIYASGGAYLIWVGVRLLRAGLARRRAGPEASLSPSPTGSGVRRPFVRGALTALSNVQALFFLASIFAGVGILGANAATQLSAVAVIIAVNGTYLAFLAWLLQRDRPRAFYSRNRGAMEIGFGMLFLLFGVRLVMRELAGWL